jgi:hypothetical protein
MDFVEGQAKIIAATSDIAFLRLVQGLYRPRARNRSEAWWGNHRSCFLIAG